MSELYDQLARALGEISTGDGWVTVRDLCQRTGRNKWAVREWLRGEVDSGRVEVGSVRAKTMTGITQIVPAYRWRGHHGEA